MFFDDLGPPWPKHPCTDNGSPSKGASQRWQSSETIIIANDIENLPGSGVPQAVAALHRWSVRNWRPLLPENETTASGDLIWIDAKIRIHGKVSLLPIPTSAWCDAPIYWRWSDEPGKIEIETIDARDILDIRTVKATIPAWLEQNDDVEISAIHTIEAVPAPTGDRWNRLGWELSFFWALQKAMYDTAKKHGWVDWPLSIRCFEHAAKAGDWAGANNLGVIYRDGHGVERDPEQAFHWFTVAANSLQDRALENLARCYREGIGCDQDPNMADFIEELRATADQEDGDGS